MIGDLLGAIKNAEEAAAKIIADANVKATKIIQDSNCEIAKINSDTQDKILKLDMCTKFNIDNTPSDIIITVDKDKISKAEKLIIEEFGKRWSR